MSDLGTSPTGMSRLRSRTMSATSQVSTSDDWRNEFDITMEDTEMMELGLSHELVGDEVYLPSHPSRDWIRCFISISGSGSYRMYIEGKKKVRFLLSAKTFSPSGPLFISSSEDFPLLDSVPKKGYFARLLRQRDRSFTLYLNHCHLCDYRLGFFTCGPGCDREVLARVSYHYQRFKAINLDYKCIKVQLPAISKSGKRKIWCPRAFSNAFPGLPRDSTMEACIKELDINSAFSFRNEMPEWNSEMRSLVVRFQGNRILTPSAKNFLLVWAQDDMSTVSSRSSSRSISPLQVHPDSTLIKSTESSTLDATASPSSISRVATPTSNFRRTHSQSISSSVFGASPRTDSPRLRSRSNTMTSFPSMKRAKSGGDNSKDQHADAVLQFGKSSSTRFTLDFRYPLSPLQAFGIALASLLGDSNRTDNDPDDLT